MIWTDWGSAPKIEKASLSGQQRVAIVTKEVYWPNGIDLDRGGKRVYWVDAGYDRVESVDYNGDNRKLLFERHSLHPFGMTLIPPFLFFTDWVTYRELHMLDATTGEVLKSFSINGGRPMGIVAYDSGRQPAGNLKEAIGYSWIRFPSSNIVGNHLWKSRGIDDVLDIIVALSLGAFHKEDIKWRLATLSLLCLPWVRALKNIFRSWRADVHFKNIFPLSTQKKSLQTRRYMVNKAISRTTTFFSVHTFHDQSPKFVFLFRIWIKVYEEVEVKIVSGVGVQLMK